MPDLNIKPTHKPIKNYYAELEKYAQHGAENEGTVRAAFQNLLQYYCNQSDLTLLCEKTLYPPDKGGKGGSRRNDKGGKGKTLYPSDKGGEGEAFYPPDKGGKGETFYPSDKGGEGKTLYPADKGGEGEAFYPPDKGGKGGSRRIQPDGEVVDSYGLPHGYWEAKDTQDNLYVEADKKFAAGYPSKNIVIQSPTHALLYQHGQLQLDLDITEPRNLVHVLQTFFAYHEENISAWHTATSSSASCRNSIPSHWERKYTADPPELQCNEVMLLPYYIANLNIEQQFYTATNRYAPYEGICLVDTFEVAEERQMHLFTPANTD